MVITAKGTPTTTHRALKPQKLWHEDTTTKKNWHWHKQKHPVEFSKNNHTQHQPHNRASIEVTVPVRPAYIHTDAAGPDRSCVPSPAPRAKRDARSEVLA